MAEADFMRAAATELAHISAELDALVALSRLDEREDSAVSRLGFLVGLVVPRLSNLEERIVRAAP